MGESVERSDLPVGQQSKGSSLGRLADALHARGVLVDGDVVDEAIAYMDRLHGRYVREVDARAEVARVRTQVAEEIARARADAWDHARSVVESASFDSSNPDGGRALTVFHRTLVTALHIAEGIAARHHAPAESVVAALPDVVGTPTHPEARDAD